MIRRNIVVIGASAGGIEALKTLTESLPRDFSAAVFIVLHIPADSPNLLPLVFGKSKLPVRSAVDRQEIEPGQIYVAPADHHLLLHGRYIELSRGPKENRHRPSIDPLFRSAAREHGNRVIGVVLSGMLDDGSAGVTAIRRAGGVCVAQDPREAFCPSMPQCAIDTGAVEYVVPLAQMPALFTKLLNEDLAQRHGAATSTQEKASEKAMAGKEPSTPGTTGGRLLPITCPDCGGTLWEQRQDQNIHFQCHVGHAYSAQTLVEGNAEALEEALWMALRIIQERITICRELAAVDRPHGSSTTKHFAEEQQDAEAKADLLRSVLHRGVFLQTTDPKLADASDPGAVETALE